MRAARANLLERFIKDAELDYRCRGYGLIGIDRNGAAGGEIMRVKRNVAMEAADHGLQLCCERGISLRIWRGCSLRRRETDETSSDDQKKNSAKLRPH